MSNINVPLNVEDNKSIRSNKVSNPVATIQEENKSMHSKISLSKQINVTNENKSVHSKKLNPFEENGKF